MTGILAEIPRLKDRHDTPTSASAEDVRPFPPAWLDRFTDEQLERLAFRTVAAGMSDEQALQAEGLTA